jgi:murein DD-endopeptidase MepM/ murein hydrolase activator NlpD
MVQATFQPSATPILAGVSAQPATPLPESPASAAPVSIQAPNGGNDPVKFTFPTPAPLPASRWRPPLYQVPWALSPYDHFFLTRPIAADEVNWPEWDYRYGGLAEGKELSHSGIDIAANRGIPAIAAGPGVIGWVGYGLLNRNDDVNDPYGLAVVVEHDFGYNGHRVSTVYGHLDRIDVTLGQRVQPGQQLGIVGTTGNSTGPHLHFEVRLQFGDYAATRNPELWLSPPQGWGVLVARLTREDGSPLYKIPVFVRSISSGQVWEVHTYGPSNLHYDDYYRENMALSDLPSGDYEVSFDLPDINQKADVTPTVNARKEKSQKLKLTIRPGGITYFTFREGRGFSMVYPTPSAAPTDWLVTPQPTPRK